MEGHRAVARDEMLARGRSVEDWDLGNDHRVSYEPKILFLGTSDGDLDRGDVGGAAELKPRIIPISAPRVCHGSGIH